MRILKVTQSYAPYSSKGGLPTKVSGIARALAARGHEVTVLTADWGPAGSGPELRSRQQSNSRRGWEFRRDGVEAVYLPTLASYRGATLNPGVLTFCLRRLRGYDVAHVYGLYDLLGCVVARSCQHRRLPYVLEPLGMFGIKVRSRQKKRLYHRLIGSSLVSDAQMIVATSEIEQEELIKGAIPDAKILLRRDGVNLAEFQT
ncbi:MAG: glycosyltransferase, partial [Pyrinomonadaceae bacterium]